MRLSYTALFLALGISSTIDARHIDIPNFVATNTTSNYQLGDFEPVRFRKRGADDVPESLWEFDVSNPNDFCYSSTDKVVLWRPDAGKKGEELQMVKIDSNQEYSITWPTKRHTMAWPSSVSLDAGEYLIGIGNATNKITLHKIPEHEVNVQKWMGNNGCIQQVKIFTEMQNSSQSSNIGI